MALEGECISTGAPSTCPDCKLKLELRVLRSAAGYYIGTFCECGPYSRESGYYSTRGEAERDLEQFVPRNTRFYL
jgi:hypothetical protein